MLGRIFDISNYGIGKDERENAGTNGESEAKLIQASTFVVILSEFWGEGGVGQIYRRVGCIEENTNYNIEPEEAGFLSCRIVTKSGDNPCQKEKDS